MGIGKTLDQTQLGFPEVQGGIDVVVHLVLDDISDLSLQKEGNRDQQCQQGYHKNSDDLQGLFLHDMFFDKIRGWFQSKEISSPIFKLNLFRTRYTKKYRKGVSNRAINILKITPLITKPLKYSHGITRNRHISPITVTVSRVWEVKVEKLFLSQSILPLVTLFQKWYRPISTYWADR